VQLADRGAKGFVGQRGFNDFAYIHRSLLIPLQDVQNRVVFLRGELQADLWVNSNATSRNATQKLLIDFVVDYDEARKQLISVQEEQLPFLLARSSNLSELILIDKYGGGLHLSPGDLRSCPSSESKFLRIRPEYLRRPA